MHVTAKLALFREFSLREAHLCVYHFLLWLAIWELRTRLAVTYTDNNTLKNKLQNIKFGK
jgi:hypothetical protein